MQHTLAKTKNVHKFLAALKDLRERPLGVEGMGILWGQPGEGKSTVISYAVNNVEGICLRANVGWTVTAMLRLLVQELRGDQKTRRADLIEEVIRIQSLDSPAGNRPIFIDEADYLLRQGDMLDALRDIYDNVKVPIIFIGMEELGRKLANNSRFSRFARRITQWIEFSGIDMEDARILVDTVCEVKLTDDLLMYLHEKTAANIGRMVTGLALIEKLGKTSRLAEVSLADWGDRPLFYGQAPFRGNGGKGK